MHVVMAHGHVMLARVCFGEEVREIGAAWLPFNVEMALADAVTDPVETHVHGLATLLLDCVVSNGDSTLIVAGDQCGWLGIAHFEESFSKGFTFLGDVEEGGVFSFCGGGNTNIDDGAELLDGGVLSSKEHDTADARAGVGFG